MLDKIRQNNSHSLWNIVKKSGDSPPPQPTPPQNKLMRESYFFMFRRLQNNVTYLIYKQHFYAHG